MSVSTLKSRTTNGANKEVQTGDSKKKVKSFWDNDTIAFIICVLGIYISYLVFGIFQEQISKETFGPNKLKFRNTPFLLFCQCIVDAIGAKIIMKMIGVGPDKTPIMEYSVLSFSYVGAMYCSNWAIQYVSFPTMVLAKSCKPIPVMLMGIFVLGKKQNLLKYICVGLITAGIAIFMLEMGHSGKGVAESSNYGLALLCTSLALDGITGPFQERLIIRHNPSPKHMMYYSNMWASGILAVVMLITNQGYEGIRFCMDYPEIIPQLALFSITSAIGQNFIYLTIYRFGSLVCSLTTTTRKFFTILLSVLWFGNSLTRIQWTGVMVVFLGLGMDIFSSSGKHKKH